MSEPLDRYPPVPLIERVNVAERKLDRIAPVLAAAKALAEAGYLSGEGAGREPSEPAGIGGCAEQALRRAARRAEGGERCLSC